MRHVGAIFLLIGLGILIGAGNGSAEPESKVHYLEDVSSEKLIEILGMPMRGVGRPVDEKPECAGHTENVRGVRPITDSVAIRILFAFDSADLQPEAAHSLDELGKALQSDKLAWSCFRIEGHTDGVGTDFYNQSLSEERAQAVVNYLTKKFEVAAEQLITAGYGEGQPIDTNETDEGRRRNRRVQIANLGPGEA